MGAELMGYLYHLATGLLSLLIPILPDGLNKILKLISSSKKYTKYI